MRVGREILLWLLLEHAVLHRRLWRRGGIESRLGERVKCGSWCPGRQHSGLTELFAQKGAKWGDLPGLFINHLDKGVTVGNRAR